MDVTQGKLDDILRKVQGLLAKADHPNTPQAEAETARNMAEALMFKYRIEEVAAKEEGPLLPEWRTIKLCRYSSEFNDSYRSLMASVISHLDIRGMHSLVEEYNEDGKLELWWTTQLVGYSSDLRFAEAMFLAASIAFGQRLEPTYDASLTQQMNAYLMRSAGMEGKRIAQAIFGATGKANAQKVRKWYRQQAEELGEDAEALSGHVHLKGYRQSYADGFVTTFWRRLYNMRNARAQYDGALVLANRTNAINEAFYEKFPQYRPVKLSGEIHGIGQAQADCDKCKKAKSGYCRDHSYLRPTKPKEDRTNYVAEARGADAARIVDLGITGREIQ